MSSISPYRRGYVFGLSFLELGVRFREINKLPARTKASFLRAVLCLAPQQLSRAAGIMIGKYHRLPWGHDHLLKVKLRLFRESRTGVENLRVDPGQGQSLRPTSGDEASHGNSP
jgi:hypothetical protein